MLLPTFAQAAALFCTQAFPAIAASLSHRATTCNGHAELCSRSYGNVTFVGAHDSYAVGTDIAANQDYDVTQQLKDGVRLLQVQALQQPNGVHLCHTSCNLKDAGLFVNYLKTVKTWVDANPNDVLTILIVNINNLPPTTWQSIYQNASMDTVSFSPTTSPLKATDWPSLGSMIDSGKRVVTFIDNQADFAQVPYIIDEFSNVWETPFDVTEASFPCNVNRTSGDTTSQLNLINHFLDQGLSSGSISIGTQPNINQLPVTNAASGPGSLGQEVITCQNVHGRPPNFLLVDFYEYGGGSVFQVAANVNGVQYAPTSPIATPIPISAGTGITSTPLNRAFDPILSARGVAAWAAIVGSVVIGVLVTL